MPSIGRRIFLSIFLILFSETLAGGAEGNGVAFAPGEKLRYALRWGIIPAGEAELEVLPIERINGKAVYHFVMRARTNAFVDAFYKLRSRIDAYADIHMTRSIKYVKKTEVRNKHKVDTVVFDWHSQVARYHQREVLKGPPLEIKNRERTTPLLAGTFDPLSAFYHTRMIKLEEHVSFQRPVSDGKKCVVARAKVLERRAIRLNGRPHDSFLILPDLQDVGGVFEKSPGARVLIWLSADQWQIPLRLKSKVIIGSFTGELVSIEGTRRAHKEVSTIGTHKQKHPIEGPADTN